MLRIPSRFVTSLLIVGTLCFATTEVEAEPTLGWQAYTAGDHTRAEAIWRPLAEKGDRNAAFGLGVLAQTLDQFEVAARWYEQAARAGLTSAQVLLGSMYIDGRGVPRDAVRAHAWLDRATLDGHANAARARDAIAAALSPEQLARANALSESFAASQ